MHALARGLLAGLTLTLSTFQPSYACDNCEKSAGEVAVDEYEFMDAYDAVRAARQAGMPDPIVRLMTAIAMAESRGKADAVGDVELEDETWGPSVGLNQVRTLRAQRGTGGPRDIERIMDPVENMRAAWELLRGQGFSANGQFWGEPGGLEQWSTVTGGQYEDWLPLAESMIGLMDRAR